LNLSPKLLPVLQFAAPILHAEALNYIVGRPTVYLDGNGTMYLKRLADGKVSQWREVRG